MHRFLPINKPKSGNRESFSFLIELFVRLFPRRHATASCGRIFRDAGPRTRPFYATHFTIIASFKFSAEFERVCTCLPQLSLSLKERRDFLVCRNFNSFFLGSSIIFLNVFRASYPLKIFGDFPQFIRKSSRIVIYGISL